MHLISSRICRKKYVLFSFPAGTSVSPPRAITARGPPCTTLASSTRGQGWDLRRRRHPCQRGNNFLTSWESVLTKKINVWFLLCWQLVKVFYFCSWIESTQNTREQRCYNMSTTSKSVLTAFWETLRRKNVKMVLIYSSVWDWKLFFCFHVFD